MMKPSMAELGHVALDGTKIKTNALKHKAMSYERMKKAEPELAAEVDKWLKAAEAADTEEDAALGDKRGDEMPEWVANKAKREKIREAMAALEAEAKAKAEAKEAEDAEKRAAAEAAGKKPRAKGGRKPKTEPGTPEDKAQRNFTDPETHRDHDVSRGAVQRRDPEIPERAGLPDGVERQLGELPYEIGGQDETQVATQRAQPTRPAPSIPSGSKVTSKDAPGAYMMDHASLLFLVSLDDRLLASFGFGWMSSDEVARVIDEALR